MSQKRQMDNRGTTSRVRREYADHRYAARLQGDPMAYETGLAYIDDNLQRVLDPYEC
jgi:hypothetical protein